MQNLKQKIEKIIEHLKTEIVSLRTARASSALIEDIQVEYYGIKTPLRAIASISSPDAHSLLIQPWDKNAIQPIEKAIQNSSLGMNPITNQDSIRLSIPSLTEERRKELLKILGKHIEEARIQIRRVREETLKEVEAQEKSKEISEDEKFRHKNEAQKTVDEANKKIQEIAGIKEKEIMSV